MDINYLKQYKIIIEAIGPVFIGSGKELNKREWVLDRNKAIAYILDERKLFNYLIKNDLLKSFEDFMLKDKRDLYRWFKDNGLYPNVVNSIAKYTLDCDGIEEINTLKGIQTFIKDGYGRPYIPGSSVKGSLRNVILSKMIRDDYLSDELQSRIASEAMDGNVRSARKYLTSESRALNQKYLHTRNLYGTKAADAVNDIMSGIRVADSGSIDYCEMTLCQKLDYTVEGRENAIPTFRECLIPGTKVEMKLTIDTSITNLTVDFIETAIKEFINEYNETFLSHYIEEEQFGDNVIYLGGGAGYHTKTVTNSVLLKEKNKVRITANIIQNTLNRMNKSKHKHENDVNYGVSPHTVKLTDYRRRLYQMGPCRISFEEL